MRLTSLLVRLFPGNAGESVLADLRREIDAERPIRATDGSEDMLRLPPMDTVKLASRAVAIAARMRLAGVGGGPPAFAGFGTELRQAARGLIKTPTLTISSVLVLALGIAAPTTGYSLIRAYQRGLPVPDPERLVRIAHINGGRFTSQGLTIDQLDILRANSGDLGRVAAYRARIFDAGNEGVDPERIAGAIVTYDLLDVLGEDVIRGRTFRESDQGDAVVLIGERLWRTRFSEDPDVAGKALRLDGSSYTIVGVLPDNVRFPDATQVWSLLDLSRAGTGASTGTRYITLGRRAPGVELERVQAQVERVVAGVPTAEGENRMAMLQAQSPYAGDPGVRSFQYSILALIGCLLLVAVSTVANLFVCRAIGRQSDIAVRSALGAGRGRIVLQHIAEAAVVSLVGGALGIAIAIRGAAALRAVGAEAFQWWMEIRVEPAMIVFALGLSMVAALIAGIVPALQATSTQRRSRGNAPGGGGFRLARASQILVVAEVGVSLMLLVPAFFITKGVLGWERKGDVDGDRVLAGAYTLRMDPPRPLAEITAFHRSLVERLSSEVELEGAAIMSPFPGEADSEQLTVSPLSSIGPTAYTKLVRITPGAFDVLGVRLLAGRDLTWHDGVDEPPAAIVNEQFAARFFPGQDPIGKRFRIAGSSSGSWFQFDPVDSIDVTIVGLVPPVAVASGGGRVPTDILYLPLMMSPPTDAYALLRATAGTDPLQLLPSLRAAIGSIGSDVPVYSTGSLRSLMRHEVATGYALLGFIGGIGFSGLLMAALGLYAVVAFTVTRRTREVGVRVALGAGRARVMWMVIRDASVQLIQGLVIGLVLALILAPALEGLTDTRDANPAIYFVAASSLLGIGLASTAIPALRALRIHPTEALRAE